MKDLAKRQAKRAEYQINQWKDQRCSMTVGGKICEGTFKCEVVKVNVQEDFRIERTCKKCGARNDIYHHKSVIVKPTKKMGTKFQEDYKAKEGIA